LPYLYVHRLKQRAARRRAALTPHEAEPAPAAAPPA
jgi:hypothetical protein